MKTHLRNVFRLPGIFVPLFTVVMLGAFLILICNSVNLSTKTAIKEINQKYKINLTLTAKERLEYVRHDDGHVHLENLNEKSINSNILQTINSETFVTDISYTTNPFYVSSRLIRSKEEFDIIQSKVTAGMDFSENISSTIYEVGIIGVSHEQLLGDVFRTFNIDAEITYVEQGSFNNGIIVPKQIYDLYGSSDAIVIGWFMQDAYGFEFEDTNGYYSLSETLLEYISEIKDMPNAPKTIIPISGYYTSSEIENNLILCNMDLWNSIYTARDYYELSENVQNYYRNDICALDEIGINKLNMVSTDASKTSIIIQNFIESGIDSTNFLIIADDYEYKFIMSKLNSIEKFSYVLLMAVIFFSIAIIMIIIIYSAKKRRSEIYTLRTLGENPLKIAATMTAELSIVILFALLFSIIMGNMFGNIVFEYLNFQTHKGVQDTLSNISYVAQLMNDSDMLQLQLENAVTRYLQSEISLVYNTPAHTYISLFGAWALSGVFSFFAFFPCVSHNLMKKGD